MSSFGVGADDTWLDELYVIQISNPVVIFDRETALYLHNLTDQEYSKIHVAVPKKYNTFRLKERGFIVHTFDEEIYKMGITEKESNFGNVLKFMIEKEVFVIWLQKEVKLKYKHFKLQ